MRKSILSMFVLCILTACGQKRGEELNFSIHNHQTEKKNLSVEDQLLGEQLLRSLLENAEERVRLLYFKEELDEDLANERAIEVHYDQPQTVQSKIVGAIEAEKIIVFGSGRLKATDSAEYMTVVTVNGEEILLWHCRWQDASLFDLVK